MLIPNLTVRCHSNTFDSILFDRITLATDRYHLRLGAKLWPVATVELRAVAKGQRGIGERVCCVPLVYRASCVSWYVLCALCCLCVSESLLVYYTSTGDGRRDRPQLISTSARQD